MDGGPLLHPRSSGKGWHGELTGQGSFRRTRLLARELASARCRGVGGRGTGFRGARGRRGMRVGNGARSAPSGRGGREGVRGNRGTGFGVPGFPRFPCRFPRPAGAARYARPVPCTLPGHLCGESFCLGRQEWGSGGKPGTGPWFSGPGIPGVPPVRFRIGLPCCLFTRIAEM